jgi:hypothetical protein
MLQQHTVTNLVHAVNRKCCETYVKKQTHLCEPSVLAQEAIARVDSLHFVSYSYVDDLRNVQISSYW